MLQTSGSVVSAPRLQSTDSIVMEHRFSCSVARGIFPDQGSNLCLLHGEVDFYHRVTREIQLWTFCPILIHDLSLPGICPAPTPSKSIFSGSAQVHEFPHLRCACLHIHASTHFTGTNGSTQPPQASPTLCPHPTTGISSWSVCNPRRLPPQAALCSFLLQPRKLMSVGSQRAPPNPAGPFLLILS